ncbi:MAG: hypothetical protein JSV84_00830 [Gemmatimonadota bacterium]|nr:MAG: hypothetical protein JSV84_00830 [Gemmatimonadota bacterium]
MPYLFVRQKVEDFERWYDGFKSHDEAHQEAGLKDLQLLRDVSDPNTVVCFFRVEDIEKAKVFTEPPKRARHGRCRG